MMSVHPHIHASRTNMLMQSFIALIVVVVSLAAGILGYNNTVCCARQGFRPPAIWQNGHFRNNLFMGAQNYAMETGSLTAYSTLDYDGYRRNSQQRFGRQTTICGFGAAPGVSMPVPRGPK